MKQLPREIEALEIELLRKFNKDPQDDRTIREILEKYLPQEQEDLDLDEIRSNIPDKKIKIHDTHDMPQEQEAKPQIEKIDWAEWYSKLADKINEIIDFINSMIIEQQ